MSAQPSSIQYAGESYAEKAERKFRENPVVPIGALATTAALSMAMVKMRAGNAKSFNNWLRMRVLFQGITIAAVCYGTYNFGVNKKPGPDQAALDALEEQKRREEKAAREKFEFEERLRMAEEMHNAELMGAQARAASASSTFTPERDHAAPPPPPSADGSQPPKSGGWSGWLGR